MRAKRADRSGTFSGIAPERAIIDIGSNTVRMVIYGGSMRAPTVLFNEKVVARLGRDIAATGLLADEAVELAMRGLRRYVLLLEELGVDDVETVATAAVRDAANGAEFVAAVAELGLKPRVISGAEEARLSASGVIGAFPGVRGVVADLGGGSLELVRIADGASGEASSLPLGTLRLHEYAGDTPSDMRKSLSRVIKEAGWNKPIEAPLYLVGGTWRAMAVYAMDQRKYPLTDPHGSQLSGKEAAKLAEKLASTKPDDLRKIERISSMRADILPYAAVLLQAMLKRLEPKRLVFSSWGLREGLLYDRLEPQEQAQDPLLAGVGTFAAHRGAPPLLAARIAGWTAGAVPQGEHGSERLRVAATMLALASMQIEPNVRHSHVVDWALHKRWIALDAKERAMLAAAIAANGNRCELPDSLHQLADKEALEEAICWGLATRIARRIGARSQSSLQVTRLSLEDGTLVLSLARSHRDLFGIPNEKDMKLLADRLGTDWHVRTEE
jgi:exopolyphosphatase/guanosine-5'-triphosphate,3'-diphosphate pyrophosphatase